MTVKCDSCWLFLYLSPNENSFGAGLATYTGKKIAHALHMFDPPKNFIARDISNITTKRQYS